jgi:hypothetical protein
VFRHFVGCRLRRPAPAIIRALEITKKALIAAGHKGLSSFVSLDRFADVKCSTVVDWKALKHPQIYAVMVSFSVDT